MNDDVEFSEDEEVFEENSDPEKINLPSKLFDEEEIEEEEGLESEIDLEGSLSEEESSLDEEVKKVTESSSSNNSSLSSKGKREQSSREVSKSPKSKKRPSREAKSSKEGKKSSKEEKYSSKEEKYSSKDESSSRGGSKSPKVNKRSSKSPERRTMRDSLVDLFIDPRKLRKTPMPIISEPSPRKSMSRSPKIESEEIPPERRFSNSPRVSTPKRTSSQNSKQKTPIKEESESEEEVKSEEQSEEDTEESEKEEKKPKNTKNQRAKELEERFEREELNEKRELIYEFWVMENQGIPVSRKYTLEDNIDEMRFEYHRLKSEGEIKDKIKLGWSVFSSVMSIGELINQRFKPLGISLEGLSDEIDSQKQEYEKVFRKIYKNMASRFYVRPGLQFAMMFGSQVLMFVIPRFLKKFQRSDEDDEPETNTRSITFETSTKINELQKDMLTIRNEFAQQLSNMQQQQAMLFQAQQKFFEEITNTIRSMNRSSNEYRPSNINYDPAPNPIQDTKEGESEYEVVEIEVTDSESESKRINKVPTPIKNDTYIKDNASIRDKAAEAVNPHVITKEDQKAADSIGEVMTQLGPLVSMFRNVKTREKQSIDQRMYVDAPEIPETMIDQHEKLVEKGLVEKEEEKTKSLNTSKRTKTWNLDEE